MLGIKDLKEELAKTSHEIKEMNAHIGKMADNILTLSSEISKSMKEMTTELHETNLSIRDSLKVTSHSIQAMSDNFSEALEKAMDKMAHMSMEINVKDTLLKSLGLDNLIPDFLKKK